MFSRLANKLVLCALAMGGCFAAEAPKTAEPPPVAPIVMEPPAPREFARSQCLISSAALAEKLTRNAAELVIIDARTSEAYGEGHMPGSRNIQSDLLQNPQLPPYYMPAPAILNDVFATAGIQAGSQVIIYDEDDGRLAARIWFTLHAYGHDRCAILDGGAGKWCTEKRPWTLSPSPDLPARGTFRADGKPRSVCGFTELAQFRVRVHSMGQLPSTTLLDARSLSEYMGEEARAKLGGHIPGAANLEWCAVMSGSEHLRVWRSAPEIHALLRMAGIDRQQKICVYDQAGGRSAHLFFTLWLMGFENAYNYVGGWREYGNRGDVEVER